MSMKRITITLPQYLYDNLTRRVRGGKISRFVRTALEKDLLEETKDPIKEFMELRKKLAKFRLSREMVLKAIRRGRLWKYLFSMPR